MTKTNTRDTKEQAPAGNPGDVLMVAGTMGIRYAAANVEPGACFYASPTDSRVLAAIGHSVVPIDPPADADEAKAAGTYQTRDMAAGSTPAKQDLAKLRKPAHPAKPKAAD